jgi:ribosome-associated protein
MVRVAPYLEIPDEELEFRTSRSSGPGGQHVNKTSSRVTLVCDVERSPSLSEEQRTRLLEYLDTRITKEGLLQVSSQRHRSQLQNREAALARLAELLRSALEEQPQRKPTKVPGAAQRRRLAEKRRRAALKQKRSGEVDWEE